MFRLKPTLLAALLLVVAASAPAAPAFAQPPAVPQPRDLAAQRAAMDKLSFLHGRWVGEARTTRPDGSVVISRSEDDIQPMLGGLILAVEGRAYAPGAPADAQPVMGNYGIFGFDERAGRYDVIAWAAGQANSGHGEMLADGAARWFLHAPDRQIRFTARPDGPDGWTEAVEFSPDGKAWTEAMFIRFKRAP